ncbi:MAG: DUF2934 domain-containing protein [Verrucomicrobiae bacterium]
MSKKKSEKETKEKKSTAKKAVSKLKKVALPAVPVAVEAVVAVPVAVEEKPKKRKVTAKADGAAKPSPAITCDDIGLRAYFIAERRHKMGWPGDSTSDWVEAERQLRSEGKKAALAEAAHTKK